MKTLTNTSGMGKKATGLLTFVLVMAMLILPFVPVTNSVVYGEEALSGGAVTTPKWTVKFLDIDGTVLKVEQVEDGKSATPPNVNAKKGYKFLGWSDWYINVTEDRSIRAVYELVMTTDGEERGKLGAAGTAEPPAEEMVTAKIAVATEGGLEVIDTSKEAITTPEVIKNNPTPTTVIPEGEGTAGLSATSVVLIILAAAIALALISYVILMHYRKKHKKEYTS